MRRPLHYLEMSSEMKDFRNADLATTWSSIRPGIILVFASHADMVIGVVTTKSFIGLPRLKVTFIGLWSVPGTGERGCGIFAEFFFANSHIEDLDARLMR